MNDKRYEIDLCKTEINTIINGMNLILNQHKEKLSNESIYYYKHIKRLFELFKEYNCN